MFCIVEELAEFVRKQFGKHTGIQVPESGTRVLVWGGVKQDSWDGAAFLVVENT